MKNILILTTNILKVTFRKKVSIFMYILLPVLGVVISILIYGGTQTGDLVIGVINMDDGVISGDFINAVEESGNNNIIIISEDEMNDVLLDGKASVVVSIPKGFSDSIISGNPVNVELISVKGEEVTAWLENFTNLYIKNIVDIASASNNDRERFMRTYEKFSESELKLSVEKVDDRTLNKSISLQSLGFLILFIMLGTSTTSELVLKEKRNRTYHRICSAPVGSRAYIASSVIANMLLIILQIVLIVFVVLKVFRIDTFVPDIILCIILMCFGAAAVGLSVMLTSFAGSSYQLSTLSTLITTPSCMLAGCYWSVELMPEIMQKISLFMPQRWAMMAIETFQKGGSPADIIINIVIMMAFAAAFFAIAAYKMTVSDDIRKFV
jgi:ABC-2 type transport system permease protein